MPLIIPSNSQSATGYTIDQSIRFNDPDNPKLGKTFSGAGTEETWTFSCWIKLGVETSNGRRMIFSAGSAGSNFGGAEMSSTGDNSLEFYNYVSGSYAWRLQTTQLLRDPAAWYHLVFVSDTTNAISSERARIYVNGQRVTSFQTASYPSASYANNFWMGTTEHEIGTSIFTTQNFDGYMAEIVNLDGTATDCNSFAEFNDSGIWIPKDVSGLTFGTNGFHIDGRDSADLGDDESGNGNDFSTSGLAAHDQVLDSPTNNFCVMSPIDFTYNELRNGNLETIGGNNNKGGRGTMGFTSGKFYWEMLATTVSDGYPGSGVVYDEYASTMPTAYAGGGTNHGAGASHNQAIWYKQSTSGTTYGSTASSGDILQYALDRDNNKIFWGVNGTFRNSGDPANGTGAVASSLTHYGAWMPFVNHGSNAGSSASTFNFGQDGTFAGAKTAQGNSDGNGVGNFYYSVPSGFLALCTKNLGS